jgi:hypothetical protein
MNINQEKEEEVKNRVETPYYDIDLVLTPMFIDNPLTSTQMLLIVF